MNDGTDSLNRLLAVVLRDSNDAITVQDLAGNIAAWNKGAEKMYGYTQDEAIGMNIKEIVPQDRQEEGLLFVSRIIAGEKIDSFETQRVTKEGILLDVWLVVTCLRDDAGNIDSIATTERDITHIKDELRRKELQLKELKGLLPICASCKKIRDDGGYWEEIENYVSEHSEAEFSHGICPECAERLYPGINPYKKSPEGKPSELL